MKKVNRSERKYLTRQIRKINKSIEKLNWRIRINFPDNKYFNFDEDLLKEDLTKQENLSLEKQNIYKRLYPLYPNFY